MLSRGVAGGLKTWVHPPSPSVQTGKLRRGAGWDSGAGLLTPGLGPHTAGSRRAALAGAFGGAASYPTVGPGPGPHPRPPLSPTALCDVRRPARGGVRVAEREALGVGVRKRGGAAGAWYCQKGSLRVQATGLKEHSGGRIRDLARGVRWREETGLAQGCGEMLSTRGGGRPQKMWTRNGILKREQTPWPWAAPVLPWTGSWERPSAAEPATGKATQSWPRTLATRRPAQVAGPAAARSTPFWGGGPQNTNAMGCEGQTSSSPPSVPS